MPGGEDDALPVFVYGTLRPGDIGYAEVGLDGRVEHLGPAQVAGTLYDLGDYPGAIPGEGGLIRGELLLPLDGHVLSLLDEYEIYDPADPKSSEFLRLRGVTVGDGLSVWIYAYNRSVTDVPVITGGDWALHRFHCS